MPAAAADPAVTDPASTTSPAVFAPRLTNDDIPGSVPDLASAPPVGWGILGAGKIAASFTRGIVERTPMRVAAVGSRSVAKAHSFVDANVRAVGGSVDQHPAVAHGSYASLVADGGVDVVYVATPHSFHLDHALLAIEAGKHVLVEKPLTRSAAESRILLDAARQAGVFCMEAVWTRFLPHIVAARSAIARGLIGQVKTIIADFDVAFAYDPAHRIFAPDLAGGALLDLGIYPIQLAHDLLGVPNDQVIRGTLAPTGVDDHVSLIYTWTGGQQAILHTSSRAAGAVAATIEGTEGRIVIPTQFHAPANMTVVRDDGQRWDFTTPVGEGKVYEAAAVARLIVAGETQSPRHPWADTLELAALLDEARAALGVVYPGE
ncbi:MAG: Gfo/Idh/MocA family oxidoreductase [Cellulomonadaceae bacterium]|jgi:predicted dehydrogenase|nr:Gfo/Idh/MocA family oxidoreductase [Cellulomonadaceae bacterium]